MQTTHTFSAFYNVNKMDLDKTDARVLAAAAKHSVKSNGSGCCLQSGTRDIGFEHTDKAQIDAAHASVAVLPGVRVDDVYTYNMH